MQNLKEDPIIPIRPRNPYIGDVVRFTGREGTSVVGRNFKVAREVGFS